MEDNQKHDLAVLYACASQLAHLSAMLKRRIERLFDEVVEAEEEE